MAGEVPFRVVHKTTGFAGGYLFLDKSKKGETIILDEIIVLLSFGWDFWLLGISLALAVDDFKSFFYLKKYYNDSELQWKRYKLNNGEKEIIVLKKGYTTGWDSVKYALITIIAILIIVIDGEISLSLSKVTSCGLLTLSVIYKNRYNRWFN